MRTYLERFYVSFVEGLTKGDIGVVTSIMVNTASRGLWDVLKGEDGARFVLPDLIVGLSRVIPEVSWGKRDDRYLRRMRSGPE